MRRFKSINTASLLMLASGLGFCALVAIAAPDVTSNTVAQNLAIKTAGPVSRVMQQVTGFTPVSGWVANRVLHRELSRYVQGRLHSRLTLFSGTDLLAGKAKSLTITGKNLLLDGYIPLSDFSFSSQSDTPFLVGNTKRPILLRPVTFHLAMVLSEQDINRMLGSEKGRQLLTNMKVKLPPFGKQAFDAVNTSVQFQGERVNIKTLMNLHGAPLDNALPMTVSGKISPEKSSLSLSDLNLDIQGIQDTRDMAQVIEHYFNELVDLNHIRVQRHKVKVQIEQSNIVNGQLQLTASMTVSPDPKALKAVLSKPAG